MCGYQAPAQMRIPTVWQLQGKGGARCVQRRWLAWHFLCSVCQPLLNLWGLIASPWAPGEREWNKKPGLEDTPAHGKDAPFAMRLLLRRRTKSGTQWGSWEEQATPTPSGGDKETISSLQQTSGQREKFQTKAKIR